MIVSWRMKGGGKMQGSCAGLWRDYLGDAKTAVGLSQWRQQLGKDGIGERVDIREQGEVYFGSSLQAHEQ